MQPRGVPMFRVRVKEYPVAEGGVDTKVTEFKARGDSCLGQSQVEDVRKDLSQRQSTGAEPACKGHYPAAS